MIKSEADKILKWSQDKYWSMKQRQRELEVPFEYYDGYADALSQLDEYVEEMTTEHDPRLEVVYRIRKISKAKVPPELINTPIGADLINIHIELNRIEQEAGDDKS
jgi:hypothetical protein